MTWRHMIWTLWRINTSSEGCAENVITSTVGGYLFAPKVIRERRLDIAHPCKYLLCLC